MGLVTMLKGGALAAVIMAAQPAFAQDRGQTLADVRQELTVLSVELQRLKGELNTTSGASGTGGAGSMLDRVNALESALSQLTGKTEGGNQKNQEKTIHAASGAEDGPF